MKRVLILLLIPIFLTANFGCAIGTKTKVPIASPVVEGDLSGIKTDITVGAGASDSIALWLAITGLVVALIAGPFGGHYYQKVLRPKRMRKEGRCGECGKNCKSS